MSAAKYKKGATDDVNVKMMPDSEKPQRPPEEEVEKYRKTRLVLVAVFLVILIAMTVAAVIIIATAERCVNAEKDEEPKTQEKSWWEENVAYQIYLPSFDNGKFSDVDGRMSNFDALSVSVLSLSPINKGFKELDSSFGTMDDLDKMVEKLHENNMKVVVDFDPTSTSEAHPWFKDSKDETSKERSYYIWKADKNSTNLPNDWKIGATSIPAWKCNDTANECYLLASAGRPKLNLANTDVKDAIKEALSFWLGKGFDGIKLKAVDELLVDVDGNKRKDVSGVHDILKDWRKAFNITGNPVMIGKISDPVDQAKIKSYYGDNDELSSVVVYIKLSDDTAALKDTLEAVFAKSNNSVSFAFDDRTNGRTVARLGDKVADAVNVLSLTLPGTPVWLYGQETGMNGDGKEKIDWSNDNNKVKNNYLKLVKMLKEKQDFKDEEMSIISAKDGFLAYSRGQLVVAVNLSNKNHAEDIKKANMGQYGRVVFDSEGKLNVGEGHINLSQVGLKPGQAVIIQL